MDAEGFDPGEADRLLTTTRSVRLRLDLTRPAARDLVDQCLRAAIQAPGSGNPADRPWIVVTDPAVRAGLGAIYRRACALTGGGHGTGRQERSDAFLAEHLGEAPVLIVPCYTRRAWHAASPHPGLVAASVYGSVYPAVWSLQLAARARGLGSCFTAAHLRFEDEAAALLAVPGNIGQAGLVVLAHTSGRFRPAPRPPLSALVHYDRWTPAPVSREEAQAAAVRVDM